MARVATKRTRRPTVKSVPQIHWTTDEQAYRAIKWFASDVVRSIRAAFDVGSTLKELLDLPEGVNADMAQAAMRYMAANPKTGRVRWVDGHQFDWIADEPESLPTT